MTSVGSRDVREGLGLGFGTGGDVEEFELEEGEFYYDDSTIDPDIALSYIDEKLQDVLGHFQKDFEGGASAVNLGAKFGGYGSFLPTYQRSPVYSRSKTQPKVHNTTPKSPNNLRLDTTDKSPRSILQLMTSFPVKGNLLSPLPDDLIYLTEKAKLQGESKPRSMQKVGQESSNGSHPSSPQAVESTEKVEGDLPSLAPSTVPTAERVVLPSVLQPILIATETQFRRDQAGVTRDVELVHPYEAEALEQVIQATGIRADAKLRRAFRKLATEEAETVEAVPSRPVSPEKPSSSSSSDKEENIPAEAAAIITEVVDSVLAAKPNVIIVPIPQATDTIEARPVEIQEEAPVPQPELTTTIPTSETVEEASTMPTTEPSSLKVTEATTPEGVGKEKEKEKEKETVAEKEPEKEKEKEAISTTAPLSPVPSTVRTMDIDIPVAPSTATTPISARLETPAIEATSSQAVASTSFPSIVPEPLSSCLSEEELEALKARLMSLISNDMSIDSCMQVCSIGAPLTPTKVGFEGAVECLKLLSKASLLQFNDQTLQMGLEECLTILRSSDQFSHALLVKLDKSVDSILNHRDRLAKALQSKEDLLAKEQGVQRVQEDMQFWITQRAKLKSKMASLLEEKSHLEALLREVNEKLEATQIQLAQTNSRIEECSPMLHKATVLGTTMTRNKRRLSFIISKSNTVLTKFRDLIANNF